MGTLDDLLAADRTLADEVHNLADEQAVFLADVAQRLAGNEDDPTVIAQVASDIQDQAGKLRALADAQRAADPGPLPDGHADPTTTLDPGQIVLGDPAAAEAPPADEAPVDETFTTEVPTETPGG